MHIGILLVGTDITQNETFKQYILRHLGQSISQIDTIIAIDDYYKTDILAILKEQKLSHLFVFANESSFNFLSKIISSEQNIDIVLKNNTLIPNNCHECVEGSYVASLFDKKINVIKANPKELLPELLLPHPVKHRFFNVFGYGKEHLEMLLQTIAPSHGITYSIQEIVDKWHKIYISSSFDDMQNFIKACKKLLNSQVISSSDVIPHIIERFDKKNLFLGISESCTGGLISATFTQYAGLSDMFELGLVTYSNEMKHSLLSVSKNSLFQQGAVSEEVVSEMLAGTLKASDCDYAIAVSGVAGPGGGSEDKPVGCVYIGAASKDSQHIQRYDFRGDRIYIQHQTMLYAIEMFVLIAKNDLFY